MGGGLCSSGSLFWGNSEGADVLQSWVMVGGCFSHDLQEEVAGGQTGWGFGGREWLDWPRHQRWRQGATGGAVPRSLGLASGCGMVGLEGTASC